MVEKDPYLIRINYCFGAIVEKDSRWKRTESTRIRVCVESRVGLDPDDCGGSRIVCMSNPGLYAVHFSEGFRGWCKIIHNYVDM